MKLAIAAAVTSAAVCLGATPTLCGIMLYQRAAGHTCAAETAQSASCVSRFPAQVIRLDSRTTRSCSTYGCKDDRTPLTGVVFSAGGEQHTLWFRGAPSETAPGKQVEVLAWNSLYIGIVEQGSVRESYYWEPGLMRWVLGLAVLGAMGVLAALIIGRFRHWHVMDNYPGVIYCVLAAALFLTVLALCDSNVRQFAVWPRF